MTRLLGIDLGTTSFKAVVYAEDGAALATARVLPPDERVEVDGVAVEIWRPERLWETVCGLTRDVMERVPDGRVDALAIAELGLVGLPLDAEREPLYPAVTWMEPGAGATEVLAASGLDDAALFAIAGNRLSPIYPPAWIGWMHAREPAFGAAMKTWAFAGDWLASRLCGELAMEYAIASQTLALDQRSLTMRDDLLAAFGLDTQLFPPLRQAGTALGRISPEAARATGLPDSVQVVLGGSDYITGVYGAGFLDPGDTAILTGTWELVVACADEPPLGPELERAGAICDPHVAPARWALRIENFAGEVTEWLRTNLEASEQPEDAFWPALVERAGSMPVGSGGVVFVPHLFGSYGPRHDELARGAFVGLTGGTTRDHLTRAVYEGLCFQTRHALEAISGGMGRGADRVVSMGGGAKNPLWLQTRADVLGRELEVVEDPDVTPRGAAMLAGVGVGAFADHRDAAHRFAPSTRTVAPDPASAEALDQLYREVYLPLCERLAEANHRLAAIARRESTSTGSKG